MVDGDAPVLHGEDVDGGVAVDAEAPVVGVGLEHEHRGERAHHAVLRGERDDLAAGGSCALGRRVDEALDLRLRPRALHQRAIARAEIGRERLRADRDLHRLRSLELRVDHDLVARLEAVERARPRPRRALDLHRDAGAGGLAEAARERIDAELRVEHDAVAIEDAADDGAEERVIADAAHGERIHALDAGLAQLLDLLLQLLAVGLAGGGDAVAHDHHALRFRAPRLLAGPPERLLEVGGAERAAREDGVDLLVAEAARLALVDRHDLLVEARHAHRRLGVHAPEHPLEHARLVGQAQPARGARVDEHHRRGDGLGPRRAEGNDARDGEIARAEAGAAR